MRSAYLGMLSLSFLLWFSCARVTTSRLSDYSLPAKVYTVKEDSLVLRDVQRSRDIPITLYYAKSDDKEFEYRPVILSHGYGQNLPGSNKTYSYIGRHLAALGFFVISIQHELPGDELLAMTGILKETRMPNWQRGADNIMFAINEFKKKKPDLNFGKLTLIGHSNGGDMSILFAGKYPDLVDKVISLDNRRMPLPRVTRPKILSLRSTDFPADEGVLPTDEECTKYGINIIFLPNTKHGEMDDKGTAAQQKEILQYIDSFIGT